MIAKWKENGNDKTQTKSLQKLKANEKQLDENET